MSGWFQTIRGAITGGGIETAPYTVLRKEKDYEERLYPAQKWVQTQLKSISKDSASSTMFWKLFNYISGQNDKQVKIPMTAPVSVYIEPGSGPNCESTFTMAFYVPSDFQGETPQPSESDVSIEERQEFRVLASAYDGPCDETSFVERALQLAEKIQLNQEKGVDFDCYYSAYYYDANGIEVHEIWFTIQQS